MGVPHVLEKDFFMTVFAYHKGVLYTDSLLCAEAPVNLFTFNQKVYKHPEGKWIIMRAGKSIDGNTWDYILLEGINLALLNYYDAIRTEPNNVIFLRNFNKDIFLSGFFSEAILMTKEYVWFGNKERDYISRDVFVTSGAGAITCSAAFGLYKDAKKAIKLTAGWDFSCGGKIHEYKQDDLLPYPNFI